VGLEALLSLCSRCCDLRILKLFKNRIGDPGALLLADFFRHCKSIREVHLSHNRISDEGIEALVVATQESRPAGAEPLWLRVENNAVVNSKSLLRDLEKRLGVCPRRESCTQFRCCIGSKVHLPFLDMHREREEKDRARREQQEKERTRRKLGLRSAGSPRSRPHHRGLLRIEDIGSRKLRQRSIGRRPSPSKRPVHDADKMKRPRHIDGGPVNPRPAETRRSRSSRRHRRAGSQTRNRAKPRSRSARGNRKRTGSDRPGHVERRSGSRRRAGGHTRRPRERDVSGHKHGEERVAVPMTARGTSHLPLDLQERLNRLLDRI